MSRVCAIPPFSVILRRASFICPSPDNPASNPVTDWSKVLDSGDDILCCCLTVDYTNGHKHYAMRRSYSMIITDYLACIHQLLLLSVPLPLMDYKRLAYKYAVINFIP